MPTSCSECGAALIPGARFCSACGESVVEEPALQRDSTGFLLRGQILEERYKLIKFLGQGGFSRVYGAVDLRLRTPCAIKENSEFDRSAYQQFITEAQLLARLRHTNLTKVTDYFCTDDGEQFLVMEYVPGQDLEQWMEQATTLAAWQEVLEWGLIVCDVLQYLHTQDPPIIHRDIKPANLRLTPEGMLMVIDLGIAKVQQQGSVTRRAAQAYSGGYSPLEQYLGQGTDARSDLYALGATLYHLLSGKMPQEAVLRMQGQPLEPLEQLRPDLPPLLIRALERTMSLDATERPPSAQALAMVLQRVLDEHPEYDAASRVIGVQTRVPSRPISRSRASQPLVQPRQVLQSVPQNQTTERPQLRVEPRPGSVLWPGDGREMIVIPAGSFTMGSDEFNEDEKPAHDVVLPVYLIDRFPVTCAEYARFVTATGHPAPRYWRGKQPPAMIEDHPVVEVTLEDAREYASWAKKRLPSEAEWEKAACWNPQHQMAQRYAWGDEWEQNRANGREDGAGGTVPIGSYTPVGDSAYGVAEMLGNIWEWTASAYKRYPYDPNNGREAMTMSGLRVTRGGSWTASPEILRAANRNVAAANDADFELGFRCAADMPKAR